MRMARWISSRAAVRPYLFEGKAGKRAATALGGFPGRQRVQVAFTGLK